MAFKEPKKKIKEDEINEAVEISTAMGTIFCHVVSTMQRGHLIAFITDGNQKWNGAIPSLIIILIEVIIKKDGS